MKRPSPRWLPAIAVAALATGATGCGSSDPSSHPAPAGSRRPAPVVSATTSRPTPATAIVCSKDAQFEIAGAIGATPSTPLSPTWADRLYTCAYRYGPDAVMTLSVKELPDSAGETAYYDAARKAAGGTATTVRGLGDQAFAVPDGSVTVRKDLTVLRIDVRGLPAHFGAPPRTHRQIALVVATTIMSCWKEL